MSNKMLNLLLLLMTSQEPGQDINAYILDMTIRRYEVVMFHQDIEPGSVDRLEVLLKDQDILDLQSAGGDVAASIRMSDLVRDRRARLTITGECASGCALVWVTARDRIVQGFSAVTFHGNPISSLEWMNANPDAVTAEELSLANAAASSLTRLLDEAGVAPWLFRCANRLQNQTHTILSNDLSLPHGSRVRTSEEYQVVWFPREILESAGVTQLDRYDRPNDRQMRAIETRFGTEATPRKIYWAQDGDCDEELGRSTRQPGGL